MRESRISSGGIAGARGRGFDGTRLLRAFVKYWDQSGGRQFILGPNSSALEKIAFFRGKRPKQWGIFSKIVLSNRILINYKS